MIYFEDNVLVDWVQPGRDALNTLDHSTCRAQLDANQTLTKSGLELKIEMF